MNGYLVRSALGVLLVAAFIALAVFTFAHGIVVVTVGAILVAGLFIWALYDNRRIRTGRVSLAAREPGAADAPEEHRTLPG